MKGLLLGALLLGLSLSGATKKPKPPLEAGEPNPDARIVHYRQGHAEKVYAMHDWSTTILLPKGERYMDFFVGEINTDKDNPAWIFTALKDADYITIAPNKNHRRFTPVTVMCQSKNPYVFIVEDVTNNPKGHADTLVKVDLIDEDMQKQVGHNKYVGIEEFDALKAVNESLSLKIEDQARENAKQIAQLKEDAKVAAATAPRWYYHFKSEKKAHKLGLQKMWTDGEHTYADKIPGTETAAFYELRDGGPLFTNWSYKDGRYFIAHRVEKGYFLVGKKKSNKVEVELEGQL